MNGPFEWVPDPGATMKVPGGVITCTEWEATWVGRGRVKGKIVFEFAVSEAAYAEAMKGRERAAIEAREVLEMGKAVEG